MGVSSDVGLFKSVIGGKAGEFGGVERPDSGPSNRRIFYIHRVSTVERTWKLIEYISSHVKICI